MLRALILAALIAPSPAIAQIAAPALTVTLRLNSLTGSSAPRSTR